MKAIQQSRGQSGPAVKLYLDDIEEIITILKEGNDSVSISDDKNSYDDIQEFISKQGVRPRQLELSCATHGRVTVQLKTLSLMGVWVYCGQPFAGEESGELKFFRILEVLNRRRRLISHLFSMRLWLCIAMTSLLMIILLKPFEVTSVLIRFLGLVTMISAILSLLSTLASTGFPSSINLSRRHETSTIVSRNAEALTVGAMGVFIGAILGVAGTKIGEWLVGEVLPPAISAPVTPPAASAP